MAKHYIILLIVRLLLPVSMLISIALRPFGLSIIYLLLYLLTPIVAVPNERTIKGCSGKFLLMIAVISSLLFSVHLVWHSVLAAFPPYGRLLDEHWLVGRIGHNLGLVSYETIDPFMAIQYLAPELMMTSVSLFVYFSTSKLLSGGNIQNHNRDHRFQQYPLLTSAGKYLCLFLIMFSGIIRPSASSGIYFLVFMGAATAWACGKPLEKGFAVVARCVMAVMACHVGCLLAYQCQWLIELYGPDEPFARYFGLTQLVSIDDSTPYSFTYLNVDTNWTAFASPVIILVTYYVLGMESRELFKPKAAFDCINSKALRGSESETTPLIRTVSPQKKRLGPRNSQGRALKQDSTGSIIVPDDESTADKESTLADDIAAAVVGFFQVLIRSSYIATTITMMTWSIMFHSWLAFVFLMWGNIVWLCPDQRSFMLKTSPLLVLYAMLLLIAQYVYGVDLTEQELPSNITNVNLRQIGLGRYDGDACIPLLIKSLFTCMFWVTLRQRVQEIRQRRQSVVVADMAAPLQLTVSTAASAMEAQREDETQSRLLKAFGEWLRSMCAVYWIYVVVIMLFVIGITGERMTIFRIIYMFLFLTFILMFQISWHLWRRFMYMFWIIVIIYSMVNLILVYVYQFDNFSKTIENYLYINEQLQRSLGLEPYLPADLFLKLLTPTLFLIITIMQVHYFHKDFMKYSDPKTRSGSVARDPGSSRPSQGASTMKDDLPALPLEDEGRQSPGAASAVTDMDMYSNLDKSRVSNLDKRVSRAHTVTEPPSRAFKDFALEMFGKTRAFVLEAVDKIFIYLDLHLVKIIFISLMLLCVMDVCAMHIPIMIMIAPGLLMSSRRQRFFCLVISILISCYFMAKMVYQINYIQHSFFDVNCTKETTNGTDLTTYNNAKWLGFIKATRTSPLVAKLKGYIALIALFTFHSLVTYRQQDIKGQGLPIHESREKVMFPDIERPDADKDAMHCLKYLFNYCFYKFGVEITLICLVGVIGSRMDVYAMLYAFWLFGLISVARGTQARVWPAFTAFVTFVIPMQYIIAVGVIPQLCVEYPWDGDSMQMKHTRTWLFLPHMDAPPHATKLIFDFFLLLFASRQLRVFRIEKAQGDNYPGGSNSENIGQDWETPDFVNPVPDFLGLVESWLDMIKRMIFLGMLWVSLAILFLTGTNRVNLFSMGYLIGSFIFLWQGTDFYLRPKHIILLWWSWLLRYNVCVVVTKTLLQIPGCIFSAVLQENACWMVQLLGIGCVDKFAGGNINRFFQMQYTKTSTCHVPQEDIGLAWDGVCFAFLILQRRLFHSYYFYRVIDESKATTVLASRGAELIEELRQKQMFVQEEQEVKILEKIKVKMERIKANQKKVQGALVKEPAHHDHEECDDDDDDEETQRGESDKVPLVRGDSDASGRGYHTPQSPASPKGFHTPISDESAASSRANTPPPVIPKPPPLPAIPPPASSHGGPPSPSSALMTVSLDAYLEPRRISFESPPSSELLPRAQSPEESYPVFSPPPIRRRHTLVSPSILQRTSIISESSRAEMHSHHMCSESDPNRSRVFTSRQRDNRPRYKYKPPRSHKEAIRSGDYYMFDEFDDTEVQLEEEASSSDDDDEHPKEMGLGKLLSTAYKTDLRRAVSLSRRASLPAVRSRSQHSVASGPHSYGHDARRDQPPLQPILREKAPPPEPDEPLSDLDETYQPEDETLFEKLKRILETTWAFISSGLWSLTRHFMKYSRDYRYVSRTLSIEKKILKEQEGFGMGVRKGSQMIWEPSPESTAFVHNTRKLSEISVPEIRILAPSMEGGLDATPESARRAPTSPEAPAPRSDLTCEDEDGTSEHESMFSLQTSESKDITMLEDQDESIFRQNRSPLLHLCYAMWFAVIAHTDIVCFIMVFVNQIQSATILSLPLPLMVFLWGTLTIPRPTKTFWVTLIAYTEVVVIIKSMFQFEILPWNQKAITANQPFAAPRIIGIERKADYALYDLLLLLIIFLHRFMLKSLGLWNESAPEPELPEEQEFVLTAEDTRLVAEGRGQEVGRKYIVLNECTNSPLIALRRYYGETAVQSRDPDYRPTTDRRRSVAVYKRKINSTDRRRSTLSSRRDDPEDGGRPKGRRKPVFIGNFSVRVKEWWNNMRNVLHLGNVSQSMEEAAREETTAAAAEDDEQAGPSKPPEDDHFSVNDEQEPIIAVTTQLEDPYEHYPQVLALSARRYLRPMQSFFQRVLEPGARVTADVYAYMFLCDFFNFLVVIFGFAAFGTHQGDGGVQTYLEENKVPIPFLVMLILQFGLIVIDRALYLRKFILGKILFQYALIIGVHVWMFFVLPAVTERTFNALPPPPMWYMVKCIYLLLSAYQIRCGYPRRIIGNFLCKNYRSLNMALFRGFMAVPFVFELRTLMDWIWTDTSMTLMDWLKMEDIFANVFLLKCSRYIEDEYPHPRGEKQPNRNKYLLGGGVLAFMIAIIWFPLVFFAFGNTVGTPNPPTDVTVKIRIGPFLPVYQMSAQSHNIDLYTELEYTQLSNLYARDRTAQTFLSNYMYNDVAVVGFNPTSTMDWVITPPELDRLKREAASNATLMVTFAFVITHPTNSAENPPTIEFSEEKPLNAYISNKRNPERDKLLRMLAGNATADTWLYVAELFPKFLKVFNKGTAKATYQLMPYGGANNDEPRYYRDVKLRLERDNGSVYWRVHEACEPHDPLTAIPLNNCDMLVMYTFNDKLFPKTLNFISGSGIIGLYTTFVFLASRVLRGFFSGIYTRIMFDDLPNVDRVLQLCLDIYLVREALELCLEEDLFAKLVFLYRSPETMIKWSRPKEEENPPQRALVPSRQGAR